MNSCPVANDTYIYTSLPDFDNSEEIETEVQSYLIDHGISGYTEYINNPVYAEVETYLGTKDSEKIFNFIQDLASKYLLPTPASQELQETFSKLPVLVSRFDEYLSDLHEEIKEDINQSRNAINHDLACSRAEGYAHIICI